MQHTNTNYSSTTTIRWKRSWSNLAIIWFVAKCWCWIILIQPRDIIIRAQAFLLPTTTTTTRSSPTLLSERNPHHESPLSLSFQDLTVQLGGTGRSQTLWEYYRLGQDPVEHSTNDAIFGRMMMARLIPPHSLIRTSVARDGTTKLLTQLHDGFRVETVILPWSERRKSTLCVSSQVGCRQACTFCQTGRMGILRNLSADEILLQMWLATKVCRENNIVPIDNVVFMGMGEPADNVHAVQQAVRVLTDPRQFQLAPRKITVSTIGPHPDSFAQLAQVPAVLAWSVHASSDDKRRQLVPTTRYTMAELREGLIEALLQRSRRLRSTMLEVTLLDQQNDCEQDAAHLAEFCRPILDRVPAVKLVVNLIPWNDIQAPFGPAASYRTPSRERVRAFQTVLVERGIRCYIRTTRGDDDSAACGQLATPTPAQQ